MFVSLISMFLFMRMSMDSAFVSPYGQEGGPPWAVMHHMHERGLMIISYGANAANSGSDLFPWLILSSLVLFFIATIALNVLFNRGSK